MRFLHLADVHLDTAFAGRTARIRNRLRDASRDAFRRAVDLALDREVHALLVAGDLFDGDRLSFETEAFLDGEFGRLEEGGVQVIYATGNHDPGRGGLRAHARRWPGNVTTVGDRSPRRLPVRDRKGGIVGWVTAAGHATHRETMDLARTFPRPVRELPEVGLLHTRVRSARDAGEHDPYAPSELEHLVRAGFHYWALGHVHTRQCLAERPAIHYPGNPQGRTPAESGPRGGLLVDLSEPSEPEVEFHVLGPVRWETVSVDALDDVSSLERLVSRIGAAWEEARRQDPHGAPDGWMLRVDLSGPCPLWVELGREDDRTSLAGEVRDALGALDVTLRTRGVHVPVDPAEHAARKDVLGETLRLVAAVREGREGLPGVGPGDLARCETDPDLDVEAYVRSLLEGAEGDVLARLLDPDGLRGLRSRTGEAG